jgi:hypothetical protein
MTTVTKEFAITVREASMSGFSAGVKACAAYVENLSQSSYSVSRDVLYSLSRELLKQLDTGFDVDIKGSGIKSLDDLESAAQKALLSGFDSGVEACIAKVRQTEKESRGIIRDLFACVSAELDSALKLIKESNAISEADSNRKKAVDINVN